MLVLRLKTWLANLALVAGSLLVGFLLLELVVFRYLLVPDDVLPNVTMNGVVRYVPGTKAVFRHPDGRESHVNINADGWNSRHATYATRKSRCRQRIAVIGDSYVQASYIDTGEAFPALLENRLRESGREAEVFRFGMDGAPLSQYLHVLRREVLQLEPDVVVIPLIHNDFDESYRLIKTRYASSFMKLRARADGTVEEIAPADFQPGLADRLRRWRTFRYVYYETGLYLHAKRWVSSYFWGGNEDWDPAFVSSAVDIRKVNDHPQNRFFARYVMSEMKKLSQKHGFKLIFVMDAVREAIYEKRQPMDYEVGRLNKIAREVTTELGLPFQDLQPIFQADYDRRGRRFEFPYDWHWNAHANAIVADTLYAMITAAGTEPSRPNPSTARRPDQAKSRRIAGAR